VQQKGEGGLSPASHLQLHFLGSDACSCCQARRHASDECPERPAAAADRRQGDDQRDRYDRDNQPVLDDLRAFFVATEVDGATLDCR